MIIKFEENGNLCVLPGRGQKLVGTETVEEIITAMVERASSSIYSSASGHSVSYELEIAQSTVWKILRYILIWYPYKIHVMQTMKPQDQKQLALARQFLERMEVGDAWSFENSIVRLGTLLFRWSCGYSNLPHMGYFTFKYPVLTTAAF
ncbi:uncharacterized protein TNCV_1282861 [Trichonephila clavipes]|uniref:Uncharacterized protein n=1 Tax=Trichonephila clavipes TaxID=2585209 RepID=A0A8X6VP08_TRICX|nr:uncharacterized protein TNCV_1282861 [Trichonephila clavipes]